ncbi:hypothetical protein CRUP_009588 [Coryphaenoides rupestris]|nr:hypothetical protein CRUP_009588 [Coryphaenoides rupestris]
MVPCLCSGASCLMCRCCPHSRNSTGQVDCEMFVGYKAVYRVCFGLSVFFLAFALITVNVKSSRDPRAALHNGFWFFKIAAIVAITVGAFYIPDGPFNQTWFVVGTFGAFCFILIQLVLLVDFAHSWNQSWVEKMERGNPRGWYAALLMVTLFNYTASVVTVAILFVFYTRLDDCTVNKFFISFNMLLCVVASLVSVLPTVQCNPSLLSIVQQMAGPTLAPPETENQTWVVVVGTEEPVLSAPYLQWWDAQSIVGLAIFVLCILYSSIRSSNSSQVNKLTMASRNSAVLAEGSSSGSSAELWAAAEEEGVGPRRVTDNERDMVHKWPAVWVKISSSWACLALYVWTLVAPLILSNRDFS